MLTTLKRIVQEVTSARDLSEALELIVVRVRDAMDAQVCSVYLFDESSRRYVLMATEGLNKDQVGQVSLGTNEGIIALVGKREEPINIEDAHNHPAFHYMPTVGEDPFNAFLAAPIIHQKRLLGVITAQRHEKRRFDESEEAFLVTVSAQLASVIAHAEASGQDINGVVSGITQRDIRFKGVAGANGVAIGTAVLVTPPADLEEIPSRRATDIEAELGRLQTALDSVKGDIRRAGEKLAGELRPEEQALFDVYLNMLDDRALGSEVRRLIEGGEWAEGALAQVIRGYSRHFSQMEDVYLRERAADIRDLGRRVLSYLQSEETEPHELPDRAIIIGEDLTPAILGEVDEEHLAGIISIQGSANSHIAILARAMGIPTVMGLVDLPYRQVEGQQLVVDGYRGHVYVNLSDDLLEHFREIEQEEKAFAEELETQKDLPCITLDGQAVVLQVNTGLLTDVYRSLDRGAEGVGLYRTEVAFMMKDRFPTEAEQTEIYRSQMEIFSPRPVTMRTLDIGGDKALPYFPIEEENPFLGWRGIRVTLDHPEIFLVQIRAMLRASLGLDNLRIMLPMISSISELDEALHLIYRAVFELQEEGIPVSMPELGMMIEVPATVYQTAAYASRVDFLSVGSNDLTQYLLAVDRNNPRVAALYSSYHPAVLQALKYIVDTAHEVGTPVSICGEMAGDPAGAVLLAAMGYDSLSMNSASLLQVKSVFREIEMSWARDLLDEVLRLEDPMVIKSTIDLALRDANVSLASVTFNRDRWS
ncbi:phosphoenolpyruvate--protein phosphotransferase [Natronospirillum operosum]|uniref:phosphoenolpyruvate--protein phosphotransferase n=1 Tax=Natronospirillum operosum TaxID=2759953 RepID=A0A4Z0W352_9GAMM|nr:phosphoenolpyruvate--protein phosphotransferase [Natronospirillum operosum]TGG91379.1 phosphoenolpyruvate--protein phosphotransferase [Natronospirillum operosum]